jgi:poly(A) polymerase
MNALFYDPEQQIVVDYVNGMNDIKNKQVKNIINLSDIFTDDPVRMIRAVKYAAATGFSIPLNLKMKISSQSNLLTSISPSRLTEEILKIINSDKACAIVDLLDKTGLYSYLQPQAAELMHKNANFRKSYLQTMAGLKGTENKRGQAISSLFRDYLETLCEWKQGPIENYKEICKAVRTFVLPMNPPRFELEYAIKKFLSAKGITIKRALSKPAVEGDKPPARRKRRRRKPESETNNTVNN